MCWNEVSLSFEWHLAFEKLKRFTAKRKKHASNRFEPNRMPFGSTWKLENVWNCVQKRFRWGNVTALLLCGAHISSLCSKSSVQWHCSSNTHCPFFELIAVKPSDYRAYLSASIQSETESESETENVKKCFVISVGIEGLDCVAMCECRWNDWNA